MFRPRVVSPCVLTHRLHQTSQFLHHPLLILLAPCYLGNIAAQHLSLSLQAPVVRFHVLWVQIVEMVPAPLPQDLRPLGIPVAAPAPAVSEMGHDRQSWVRASRHVDDMCHARNRHFVEDIVGTVDCGEDDPVGEKAAGYVIEVCPAGAEFIPSDVEISSKAVLDFTGGIGGWALGPSVEPVPFTHDLVPGLLGHAEVFRALHIRKPYVLEILLGESHRVKPDVEMEEENAIYLRGTFIGRCVEDELHGVPKGLVCGKSLLERVMGKVYLVLVRSEIWHANVCFSEEGFIGHHCRYPFRAVCVDSNKGHAVFER